VSGSPIPDNSLQHELNDFLQSELMHSLGSYGVSLKRFEALKDRLESKQDAEEWAALFPARVVARNCDYNRDLRNLSHLPSELRDDYSLLQRSVRDRDIKQSPAPRHPAPLVTLPGEELQFEWVVDFYKTGRRALEAALNGDLDTPEGRLGERLSMVHDPQRQEMDEKDPKNLKRRIERTSMRLDIARLCIPLKAREDRAEEVLGETLDSASGGSALHTQVLAALVEAHLRMHRIEHLQSHNFGDNIRFRPEIDAEVAREAEHSLVLNTFVYAVARGAPWIFAENELERDYVLDRYKTSCATLSPTYCMWIGMQLVLLSLHRRGYTWWLLGKMDRAYGDFYKLKRLIAHTDRVLEEGSIEAPGARSFIGALSSLADHHTGAIYQAQHAHTVALRHFRRAATRLARLEQGDDMRQALLNSRWRIYLLLSEGRASYELGLVKRALLCYVGSWRAFLELTNTESATEANFEVADRLIQWLETIADEPEIDKRLLAQRVAPLVAQFDRSLGPLHLRLLAARIIMLVGHVLLILRLPRVPGEPVGGSGTAGEPGAEFLTYDDHLAGCCLEKAAELDPHGTSIISDLLKIDYRKKREARALGLPVPNDAPRDISVAKQWPSGGGEFEESAKVIELILQRWLNDTDTRSQSKSQAAGMAREMLAAFLSHTDSSNVKLAQVYRYLMQKSTDSAEHDRPGDAVPTLELVCARRYSSFFPFLPRPSAFRVPGGGYFVRIREGGKVPFGIVIDPGPNFLHNLYSCGYSLDDVHLVIVTHDHADHLAALDALLSLLGYRARLGATTFKERSFTIVGNASVKERYAFFNDSLVNKVAVLDFEQFRKITCEGRLKVLAQKLYPLPKTLAVRPVATVDHPDAAENIAQGFVLEVGTGADRSSVFFTSDTGIPPELGGPKPEASAPGISFVDALKRATIVVAHLSSVRTPELREIGELTTPSGAVDAAASDFDALWEQICEQKLRKEEEGDQVAARRLGFLLRELQFGFHSLPNDRGQLTVSPLAHPSHFKKLPSRHLYLRGLLAVARRIAAKRHGGLLLIGELREELGTFRTGVAATLNESLFADNDDAHALTMDIGLRLRIKAGDVEVLCTTCDLDNDLVDVERFHSPADIHEVCVKGEDEGIFYNCTAHDRRSSKQPVWLERVERYNPFGRYDPFRP
jgi:Beta-lactamase superfamily domain